ncbi:YitT family protein [Zobellella iuensis]|uniref:YitT family protein n=1 Tax=Zobellella iuensis TaxID=2803811 RepID=A0ABS1QWL0_9GAMM|nr:YitT family protein [Zobellella iuensis]MBL1379275.1 YitT family protein [Zobellella iuensis]
MNSRHPLSEDIIALLSGTLLVALGVFLLKQAGLLTGGTAGIALLLAHFSGTGFGVWFFLINLPFYALAWLRMGPVFTFKTFVSVSLVSLFSEQLPRLLAVASVSPPFAALMGGLLIGVGMLILFRHQASLGGIGILALYLQGRFGISAGKLQMAVDSLIVLVSFTVVPPWLLLLSVLGAVLLNQVLAFNHKPGRYSAPA